LYIMTVTDCMAANIMITGADGQLGSEIKLLSKDHAAVNFFFTDIAECDITDKQAVAAYCRENKINTIINAAAFTAVDRAESQPEAAYNINHQAVVNLAEICNDRKISLIHISTDFIFDGCKNTPYTEGDPPGPLGVYGASKLAGEEAARQAEYGCQIIRTSWLYSGFGHNFMKTMLCLGREKERLTVVFDQVGTPTWAADLAAAVLKSVPLLRQGEKETFHFANEGVCSWYDFSAAIMQAAGLNCRVYPVTSDKYPTACTRPAFSVMNKDKIKSTLNITIPHWRDSLEQCLTRLQLK